MVQLAFDHTRSRERDCSSRRWRPCFLAAEAGVTARKDPLNIVLIVADDYGWTDN